MRIERIRALFLVPAAILAHTMPLCVPLASAQCGDWRPRSGMYLRGSVYDTVAWDPDGAGPQPPLLVVGGDFERAGAPAGSAARNIAAWDGESWQSFGEGMNNDVLALAVYNGQLIAGGGFTLAAGHPCNYIARWDGTTWQPLGGGVTDGILTFVGALAVYNNELFVGGNFQNADGQIAHNIARWNGTNWQPVGDGIDGHHGGVYGLAVYNNELIAGGSFASASGQSAGNIARWSAALGWRPLGSGIGTVSSFSPVLDVAVYNNQLIACGIFSVAGGLPADDIARWDGNNWHPLGAGLNDAAYELEVYHGALYVGGNFELAGGEPANHIARWDGSSWSSVRNGTDEDVLALCTYNGELIAGGFFSRASAGSAVDSLARWDGENWWDIPGVASAATGQVNDVEVWADQVGLAGSFHTSDAGQITEFYNLAKWDGVQVSTLGTPDSSVHVLATAPGIPAPSTDLFVGGNFTSIDGVTAAHVARINDTLATGWQAMGAGFNGNVYAIERFNGSIYAAGAFSMSGATPVSRIARWNGAVWEPLGAGLNGTAWVLKAYNGYLYVGGSFTDAGGIDTGRLARWNGSAWSACSRAFEETFVEALEVYNGQLVIGGYFPAPSPNITRFNGSLYSSFAPGGADNAVRALAVSNGTLVIGGDFANIGGVAADHVARWDGTSFSAIRGGTDGPVYALASCRNEIHVGGAFSAVRTETIHSERWARYSEDGAPWIARQPQPDTVNCGGQAGFHAFAVEGYGPVFQWRKDGVPLDDGPTGTGSTIIVNGNDLYVQYAGPDDQGVYDCIISNGCGSDTSDPVTLTVIHCCAEDLNGNSEITLQDLALLLSSFGATGGGLVGDIDGDNDVDLQDLAFLLAVFGTQCP